MSSSKKFWPLFLVHIGNYSILNGKHARKEAEVLQDICLFLGSAKGHDPQELEVSHVRAMGLNHYNIHLVDFDEYMFKGIFFYEEVLHKLHHDVFRKEIQLKKKK
jgi:hypothetical protein